MDADHDALRLAELASIGELLRSLEPGQWDQPSLCEGWRVRDVIGHLCVGYTTPMPTMRPGRRWSTSSR